MMRREFLVSGLVVASSAQSALAQCGANPIVERVERKPVPLLLLPDGDYRFYYRLEQEVVYIPVESVLGLLGERMYRATELVQKLQRELPLQRHTDVFAVFLNERFTWVTLSYVLAEVLQRGEASVWNVEKGLVKEIEVEHHADGCNASRKFRYEGRGVFFSVHDSQA